MADEQTQPTAEVELTLKQLQDRAIELGMPVEDAELFKTKAPLQATIAALEAANASKQAEEDFAEPEVAIVDGKKIEKVKTIEERPNPQEERATNQAFLSKAKIMRNKLEKQPKVRWMIPLEGEEKPGVVREIMGKDGHKEYVHVSGAIVTVQLNGYKTLVPKGVFVDIPQQVADELAQSMQQTQDAGADFKIDRVDPKTGISVSQAL